MIAEPATTDLYQLDAFHALLPALARALDIRDVFQHLSAVASQIVPHDEANLALAVEGGSQYRLYASTGDGNPELLCRDEHCVLKDPIEPRLLDAVPGPSRGLRSGVCAPVLIDDKVVGVFALFSKRPNAYTPSDLALAQRLAGYIAVGLAHQRLAEAARRAAVERERTASIESSVELLRTISGVLDIRTVFPRVSEIANKVLPHDLLTMMFHDRGGEILIEVTSSSEFPELTRLIKTDDSTPKDGFIIIDDFTTATLPVVEPADVQQRIVAAGYRSLLVVVTRAGEQEMGLGFWSKRPHAFAPQDVPVARRLADHVALAVSHEQLAEAARQVAEAHARAERLESRVKSLVEELESKSGHARVVGQSPAWLDTLKKAAQVADTETTVLLTGESGTGKEVVARFVHRASARKGGPFIALNCAALPEQLLESELFGYERGAFTGAQQSKPGQIELAAGGVLFLDEVSEMSPSAQAKFLRVLQEREFQRLGGTRLLKANVRIIAATNRDLRKAVERGDFREDLFYRLQVFDIRLAPLRERKTDIVLLSDTFLQEIASSFGRPPAGLTRDARETLLQHDWPGNVRELRNALERAAILCEGGLISAQHLSLYTPRRPDQAPAVSTDLSAVERETIERVMRECQWNKSKAAKRLGLSRTQLYVRLRKYDLDRPAA
ncbi:MAG TPA: sigma 54-interacting transcriptional regulator [Vicinamibacterales bacterium]|nr:sigma 54-interacting transcriptional regulator [Vicinamibacterales bacterium]